MIQGRITSLHISSQTVHVVEAEVNRGKISVQNAFTMRNMQRFFTDKGKIINLASMIETIVMALNTNGITGKRLMITFDGVFQTSFSIEAITGVKKDSEKKLSFSFGKKDKEAEDEVGTLATIKLRQKWGQYITQDDQGEAISITLAERDLVESMVSIFDASGYRVLSLEAPETTLVYVRNAVEYNYDYLHKIIIYADTAEKGEVYTLTKDVPSVIKTVQFDGIDGDFEEKIIDVCEQEARTAKMRNPFVYLIGEAFKDINEYISIAERLEESGIQLFDLYGIADNTQVSPTAVQIQISQSVKDELGELTCEYGMCIAQLMRCFEKEGNSLCGSSKFPFMLNAKNKKLAVKLFEAAAILFLVVNIAITGLYGFEVSSIKNKVQDVDYIRSQLQMVEGKRNTAKTQLMALDAMDDRLKTVFEFALDSLSTSLNIASIDTADMLVVEDEEGSSEETEEEPPQEQDPTAKQTIIVRGYSTRSSGPVEFYNSMVAHMDQVKLVGNQQMVLPSGETIYAFEIQVGGEGQ